MKQCPFCAASVAEDASVCPQCNSALAPDVFEQEKTVMMMPEEQVPLQQAVPVALQGIPAVPPAATSGKKKSSVGLIIGISVGAVVLVGLIVGGMFFGAFLLGSKKQAATATTEQTTELTTAAQTTAAPETSESTQQAHADSAEVITGKDALDGAQIQDRDAIDKIESFSNQQLGVNKNAYSFMVAHQAYVIEDVKYVQVIAAQKQQIGDGEFSITPAMKYYISFDGETILKEDVNNPGVYEEIEQ